MHDRLVIICGPTAAGKTGAAIRVCEAVGGEVVSADAVQIYRHLDIGSAKPTAAEQMAAKHHLIDVVDPDQRYSAARYVTDADGAIAQIRERGRVPVVVHLLAPNGRPAQITQDLESFWSTTYAAVRRDLRGRYPKHAWPEDPRSVPADFGVRRRRRPKG